MKMGIVLYLWECRSQIWGQSVTGSNQLGSVISPNNPVRQQGNVGIKVVVWGQVEYNNNKNTGQVRSNWGITVE